jgi:hypothetical protein
MATTISDLTNSTSLDGLLKKVYLPTMQHTAYDDTRFSDLIQTRTDLIPGGGNHIVHFASTQRAEGVGTISEGGNWVQNVPVKGKQMTENVKYLNSYVALTGPVIKAANSGQKGVINVVTETFRSNIRSFKNNFDRMLMGDASAQCGRVSAISSGTSITLTNTSFPNAPYFADMFMPIGGRFESATFDSAGVNSDGHNNSGSALTTFLVSSRTSQDLDAGTSVMVITDSAGSTYSAAGALDVAVGDFFFREGAYGSAGTAAVLFANCQEINGLNNLVSDGSSNSETGTNYTSIWGLTRTSFWYLQSLIKDFSSARLDEENMTALMMDLQFSRQAQPNLLLTTPKAENKYFLEKKDDRRFNNVGPMSFVGGYTRLGVQLGEWQLILSSLGACPQNSLFVINTGDFAFCQNSPIEWVLGDGGNVLVQSHTGDNKFATAVQYVNFVCFDPYRQAKGFGILET